MEEVSQTIFEMQQKTAFKLERSLFFYGSEKTNSQFKNHGKLLKNDELYFIIQEEPRPGTLKINIGNK